MAETARAAGLSKASFARLLADIAAHPEPSFESLRELLCDATAALLACGTAEQALGALRAFDRGSIVCVPGVLNATMAQGARITPRFLMRRMTGTVLGQRR